MFKIGRYIQPLLLHCGQSPSQALLLHYAPPCAPVSVAEEAVNSRFWFSTNVSKVLHGSQQEGPFSVFMSTHAMWVRGRHGGAGWWKDPGLECHDHGLFTEFR